jgi:hypothetical protein
MRRRALSTVLSALVLGSALAACSDDSSDPDESAPSAMAARDSHETSQVSARSAAAVAAPEAPLGLVADATPRIQARSARLGAEATAGDFGCFTDASPVPSPASIVDCAEAHGSEQYGVLPMDGSWPEDYEAYAEGTETGTLWRAWAGRACDALQQQVNGSDPVAAALGLGDASVYPGGFTANGFAIPTRSAWAAGDRNTYCVAFTVGDHQAEGSWTPLLMSAERPDALTVCKGYVAGEYVVVPCSEQHWREEAFFVNATAVLDQAFVDSVDPAAVTDEQWAALDEVCARGEEAVIGADRDDLKLYSDVVEGFWGDTPGWYPVNCGIVPEDGTLDMVGTAFGVGDGDIVLVPTAVPAG